MTLARRTALLLLLVPIVAGSASGFRATPSPVVLPPVLRDTVSCLDTLQTSDSVLAVVAIRVRPQDSTSTLPSDFEGLFAQEVSSRLKVPGSLLLGVMGGWDQCDPKTHRCVAGVPILGVDAYATAHPTGKLSRIAVIDGSLTPSFSDSVRRTLERIGLEKGSPPFLNRTDSIPLKITIGVQQHSDTAYPYRSLFRIKLPHYNLPFTFAEWPKNAKKPHYPLIGETRGVTDTVALTFTVLPDGSVAPQSVDIAAGSYINFAQAVLKMLASAKYVPARLGGCPAASRASQIFEFGMRR
jgi:TonB-like protein